MQAREAHFSWRPIGGLGEVGMNCMVFEFPQAVIPVDAGVLFADPNDFGIEVVFPDFKDFLLKEKPKRWLITHGHEDHIGAVPEIFRLCKDLGMEPPTFYAPPFAAALIRDKLSEHLGDLQTWSWSEFVRDVDLGTAVDIEGIEVTWVESRHSTPQSAALVFRVPSSNGDLVILHTADFKLDHHEFEDGVIGVENYKRALGNKSPDVMFVDSTNADRPGHSVSEIEVIAPLEELIGRQNGRVFVTLFSSNMYRVASLLNIAKRLGRQVSLAGRSMNHAFGLAQKLGLAGASLPDVSDVVLSSLGELKTLPREKQMIVCSGSQGEPRSVLSRLALGTHPDLAIEHGDTVLFSSKLIPGNERTVSRLVNGLMRRGATVIQSEHARALCGGPIHASGHARRDEIASLVAALAPKNVVPVHGELRQLMANRQLILETGSAWGLSDSQVPVVENGSRVHFVQDFHGWRVERVEHSAELQPKVLRFDSFRAHSRDPFLRDRKRAAAGGVVALAFSKLSTPRVNCLGVLPETSWNGELLESWAEAKHNDLYRRGELNGAVLSEAVRAEISEECTRYMKRVYGIRPLVVVQFLGTSL